MSSLKEKFNNMVGLSNHVREGGRKGLFEIATILRMPPDLAMIIGSTSLSKRIKKMYQILY
ncbi:MAG: hypothetical protein L6M37_06510 [Candidatus Methylarchaceae archaeon HK02M1]|nr:hypothetical protein [Candidatus Methylarchaceae archaeon HK02M1]